VQLSYLVVGMIYCRPPQYKERRLKPQLDNYLGKSVVSILATNLEEVVQEVRHAIL